MCDCYLAQASLIIGVSVLVAAQSAVESTPQASQIQKSCVWNGSTLVQSRRDKLCSTWLKLPTIFILEWPSPHSSPSFNPVSATSLWHKQDLKNELSEPLMIHSCSSHIWVVLQQVSLLLLVLLIRVVQILVLPVSSQAVLLLAGGGGVEWGQLTRLRFHTLKIYARGEKKARMAKKKVHSIYTLHFRNIFDLYLKEKKSL